MARTSCRLQFGKLGIPKQTYGLVQAVSSLRPFFLSTGLVSVVGLMLFGCATYQPAPRDVRALGATPNLSAPLPAESASLLSLALERDPALAAAKDGLRAAEAGAKAARNRPPMTLTLTSEYSRQADAQRPWLYAEALDVPVDIGNRRATRLTTADLAVVKARYAVGEAAWKVRQDLMQGLADLATSKAALKANQDLIDRRNAYARLIETRAAAGEDTHAMAAQARLDASVLVDNLLQAQAQQARAKAALAHALNAPLAAIDALSDLTPAASAPVIDLSQMSERALYIRQDVLTAVADYDSAENDLRAAVAGQYPDISLSPGYTWERGVAKFPLVGTFTLPPLDLNRANIRQAEAARSAAGKTLEDKVRAVGADIAQAAMTYDADRQLADKTRAVDLPLAEDLTARMERMKTAGESDQTDLLNAQIALAQTRLAVLNAEAASLNDRLRLEDALHQSFDPVQNAQLDAAVNAREVTH